MNTSIASLLAQVSDEAAAAGILGFGSSKYVGEQPAQA